MANSFKSMQTTAKYHFERQLIQDTRTRIYMWLLTTDRTPIQRRGVMNWLEDYLTIKNIVSLSNLHAKFIIQGR